MKRVIKANSSNEPEWYEDTNLDTEVYSWYSKGHPNDYQLDEILRGTTFRDLIPALIFEDDGVEYDPEKLERLLSNYRLDTIVYERIFNHLLDIMDNPQIVESSISSEFEYRKKAYLDAKRDYEQRGEYDNNDVISREDKMYIARGQMNQFARDNHIPKNRVVSQSELALQQFGDETKPYYRQGDERTFGSGTNEYRLLEETAYNLREFSPNGHEYIVKDVYLDYGMKWMWTTIVDVDAGHGVQVLNPRQWLNLLNGVQTPQEIADEVLSGDYCCDKIST